MALILLNRFKSWIVGGGAILLLVLGIYTKGRSDGKAKAIEDDRKELAKDVATKKQIDLDLLDDSDDDLDDRLRHWIKN